MGPVAQEIERVLVELLEVPPATLSDDLMLRELETWDSLMHMELIASFEQCFEIELSFDEIIAMQSVGEIRRILSQRAASA